MPALPATEELRLTLRMELRLTRSQPLACWTAELCVPGMSGHLMFPSLPALVGWMARLDPAIDPTRRTPTP